MVEGSVGPRNRVMAVRARCREGSRYVIHGRGRGVVILLVAADACGVCNGVVVVDVAIRTLPRRNGV